MNRTTHLTLALAACAAPGLAAACACGCGVFDVGTSSMFPTGTGGMVFIEQDFMDQNQNWSGTASAAALNNSDQRIRTNFWTMGAQYTFTRSWSVAVEVPYWDRLFDTIGDTGTLGTFNHSAQGDVRVKGIYTGLSPDLSTGITFGVKLPTGDSTYANFDPDTEIGTGSTDLLLGAYHLDRFGADSSWSWFANAQWEQPVAHKAIYRPGAEIDAVVGTYYRGWNFGGSVRITPVLQIEGAYRRHDGGTLGQPQDSGYTRAFLTPGIELDTGNVRIYADVANAVYTNSSGNQLMARTLFKLNISAAF
ncbi:MAG TPA: hypothetical protein VEU54_10255 [Steroidobacteraceae bacterium]|nr:hypothetical protein [Steroidobacteraceae bacterium]